MATEVRVPTLGESVTEATVATWFKQPGEAVAVDEMLCELETDKVTVEVPSPVAGVLTEILAAEGDVVEVGQVLCRVGDAGEAPAAAPADAAPQADAAAPAASAASANASASDTASDAAPASGVRKIAAPEPEAIDLLDAAGGSMAKRAMPVALAAILAFIIYRIVR